MGNPVTKLVNYSTNLYSEATNDTLIAWMDGVNFSPATIDPIEKQSIKDSVTYTSLSGILSPTQITNIQAAIESTLDTFVTNWNANNATYLGFSTWIKDGATEVLGNFTTIVSGGNIYTRTSAKGTALYKPVYTIAERASIVSTYTSNIAYTSLTTVQKSAVDPKINTVVDALITLITAFSFTANLYDYAISQIAAPVSATASEVGITSFKANWASVAGATSYDVHLSPNLSFSSSVTIVNTNFLNYVFTGLSAATQYYYKVVAKNALNTSLFSEIRGLTTLSYPTLIAPVATSATNVKGVELTANWGAVTGATSYTVSIDSNPAFTAPITYSTTNLYKVIGGLSPTTTYYYRVVATNPANTSPVSNTITTTTTVSTAGVGQQISYTHYADIRNKVIQILGPGSGQSGYGQTVTAPSVGSGTIIRKVDWDALRADIRNIKTHQDGLFNAITLVTAKQVIEYGSDQPVSEYETIIDQAVLDKFSMDPGEAEVNPGVTTTRIGSWTLQSQCEIEVVFSGYTTLDLTVVSPADHARYFFNSGGRIRFFSERIGGTTSGQNTSWTNLLSSVGTVEFGADIPVIENFYTLTNAYQTIYQLGSTPYYSSNYFKIEAKNLEVADNSAGGAETLRFLITWQDDYTDGGPPPPGDSIDGTLSLAVTEYKAADNTGTGTFKIESPTTYNLISAISAT
jgi:hypothetical protein